MTGTDQLTIAYRLQRAGQRDQAADAYGLVLAAEPDHPAACLGLALIELDRDRAAQALTLLERALRREPDAADIVFHLGRSRVQLGDRDRGRRDLLRAAELARADPPLTLMICRQLVREGLAREALAYLQDPPATPEAFEVIGEAQLALGDHPAAAATLERTAGVAPGRAQTWRLLSVARARLRDYPGAVAAYETFLRLIGDGGDGDARAAAFLAYADLLLMARRPDEARAAIARAIELGADRADAQIVAAKCARLAGDTSATLEHLRRALEQRPTSGEAWQLRLEVEEPDALARLAARCGELALQADVPLTDRCVLAYAAGNAFDRAGEHGRAFAQYRTANSLQRQDQTARGLHYDRDATERLFERYLSEFTLGAVSLQDGHPASTPIFIVGMPRSGTTLVERILGGLEGVRLGGENEALEFIATRYYWERDGARRPPAAEASPETWTALAGEYWRRTNVSPCRITDKMPQNFRHVGLLLAMFPAARVIYLYRDPRDTCLSIYARMFPDGHLYATDLGDLAHYFASSRKLMLGWQARHPASILEVCYEGLIVDPVTETRRVADFCGLVWRPECLDFHKQAHASFTFSEMQVREPLNDRGVGAWRNHWQDLQPLVDGLSAAGIPLP